MNLVMKEHWRNHVKTNKHSKNTKIESKLIILEQFIS